MTTPPDLAPLATRNGSSRAYRKARKAQLEAHPLCQDCGAVAVETDHVLGVANDPNHEHLESVCHVCHATRTAQRTTDQLATISGPCGNGVCNCPAPTPVTQWPEVTA